MKRWSELRYFVLFLAVLVACECSFAESGRFELLDVSLPPRDVHFLFSLAEIQDLDELVGQVSRQFPDIYFVPFSLSLGLSDGEFQQFHWRDPKVRLTDEMFYQSHISRRYDNEVLLGGYVPPFLILDGETRRPLREFSVILLNQMSSKGAILHELVHYLIDKERTRRPEFPSSDRLSYPDWKKNHLQQLGVAWKVARNTGSAAWLDALISMVLNMVEVAMVQHIEETEIVVFLAENSAQLGLDDAQIARQLPYGLESLTDGMQQIHAIIRDFQRELQSSNMRDPVIAAKVGRLMTTLVKKVHALEALGLRLDQRSALLKSGLSSSSPVSDEKSCQGLWAN